MKLDINKVFYGPVRKITKRTYVESDKAIVTTKPICYSLFYQIDINLFLDLITKEQYFSDTSPVSIGGCVVYKKELTPINTLFKKIDIAPPKKAKTSSKELKLAEHIIINETMYRYGKMSLQKYNKFKESLQSYCDEIRVKQKKKNLYIKREK